MSLPLGPFLSNPYTWLALSALTFGAATARVSRPTARAPDPELAWTRKWVFFCVFMSMSLLFALAAIFLSDRGGLQEAEYLYFFVGGAFLFFLVFRFRRTAGTAFLFLLLALGLVTFLFLQSLRAFTGETEIARVRALSVTGEGLTLDLFPPDGDPVVVELEGDYFGPVVRVVIFDDAFVFLGARTWYRFEGLVSFSMRNESGRSVVRQMDTVYTLPEAPGISERLYDWFEANENRIPGVKTVQIDVSLKRPRELATYSIRVQNDGGVEIVQLP